VTKRHETVESEIRNEQLKMSKELHSLSAKHDDEVGQMRQQLDGTARDLQRVSGEVASLRTEAKDIEAKFSREVTQLGASQRTELHSLKEFVSTQAPPRTVGGFKAAESIRVFVAGLRPLSEGILAYLTTRSGSVSRSRVSRGCRLRDDWQGSHRRSFRRVALDRSEIVLRLSPSYRDPLCA
jgi:hypothetical protein